MTHGHEAAQSLPLDSDIGRLAEVFEDYFLHADCLLTTLHELGKRYDQHPEADEDTEVFTPEDLAQLDADHNDLIHSFQRTAEFVLKQPYDAEDKARIIASQIVHVLSGYGYAADEPSTGLGTSVPRNQDPVSHARHQQNFVDHEQHSAAVQEGIRERQVALGWLRRNQNRAGAANAITRLFNDDLADVIQDKLGLDVEREVAMPHLSKTDVALKLGSGVAIAGTVGLLIGIDIAKMPLRILSARKLLGRS